MNPKPVAQEYYRGLSQYQQLVWLWYSIPQNPILTIKALYEANKLV